MESKIMELIKKYAEKHPLAKDAGSEYIYQNDEAQIDALDLVANIFNLYVDEDDFEA